MLMRLTAAAVWVAALCAGSPAVAADRLTLDDAFARVATQHPDLALVTARGEVLDAERDLAELRPQLVAGVQLENALGTDAYSGFDSIETTFTLASVLERGGKLDARRTLAQSRIDQLAVERETRRLDLLAEVARRYLALSAAERQRNLALTDIQQRQRTVAAARTRLQAGASPESVVLTAEAALARGELARARANQQWIAARQHLAALWGERDPSFEIAAGNPLVLPRIVDGQALAKLLESTPELARFAGEARVAEARAQLARTQAVPDLDWQVGVRDLRATRDVALMATLSMPLGAKQRAQPAIRAANAELAQVAVEREAAGMALYSTLIEAQGRYAVARLELERLAEEVLPALARAETAAERAYRAGAVSYLEWALVQAELTATRRQQLDVAIDAQRALIEIQRLTGQPIVAGAINE